MVLMALMGVLLGIGMTLTILWARQPDVPADASLSTPAPRTLAVSYGREVIIGIVGGVWAGALVTGPAVRLIMRLLAVTAGDAAQGRITEAEEVVGSINAGGTFFLWFFGGILTGLLTGVGYVLVRRWLPAGRWRGLTFGVVLLALLATRVEPLRPNNPDFDLVGPAWLAVLTFGLATVIHGVAVVAFAERYRRRLRDAPASRSERARQLAPAAGALLMTLSFGVFVIALAAVALLPVLVVTRIGAVVGAARSPAVVRVGRAVGGVVIAVLGVVAVGDLLETLQA